MKSPFRVPPDDWNRRAHQMLSTIATRSAATRKPYRMRARGRWKLDQPGASSLGWGVLSFCGGGLAGFPGLTVNPCRCRPTSMITATAIIPPPSTKTSTPRSLAATSLAGTVMTGDAFSLSARRLIVTASRTPSTTSSAKPMTTSSRCSGPSHRGFVTAPCSPVSPRMISSASGSTSTGTGQRGAEPGRPPPDVPVSSGVPVSPGVPGGIVPGWRLVMVSCSLVGRMARTRLCLRKPYRRRSRSGEAGGASARRTERRFRHRRCPQSPPHRAFRPPKNAAVTRPWIGTVFTRRYRSTMMLSLTTLPELPGLARGGGRYLSARLRRGCLGLGGGLQGLLVGSHPAKRGFGGDIRDRITRPLGTERARRLLPARRAHPQLLAEQGHEDLRLLRSEPRQRRYPLEQLGTRPGGLPQSRGFAVILLHEQPRQVLHARRHRLRVTVQGGPFGENERQRIRVEFGEFGGGRLVPEPPRQVERRAEGALERYLLVEQHSDQQGKRAAA